GNYIKAVDGGGGDVEASAEVTNTDEEFYLLDIKGEELESGDVVSFLTYDTKHFLTPNDGGIAGNRPNNKLVATRATLTDDEVDWDKFEIEKVTDTSNETIHSGDFIALYDI